MKLFWVVPIAVALAAPLTVLSAAPAAAQAEIMAVPMAAKKMADQKKAAELKKKSQAIDEAYQATTATQPVQKPKTTDPWSKMR
jgi:hypothetical protein